MRVPPPSVLPNPSMQELPTSLKMITVWLVVGVVVFLGFRFWEAREQQMRVEVGEGGVVEIRRGRDGHYHWPGSIDGRPVDFLVDTGATRTAIPMSLARSLDLEQGAAVTSSTANGITTGRMVRGNVSLRGGVAVRNLPMVALPDLGDSPLLGMDVLGRLPLQQRDGVLRIELGASAR